MLNSLRKQRVFLDRLNPLERIKSDEEIRIRFRFRRPTIYQLDNILRPVIERPTNRSKALPTLLIICVALRFYGDGSFYLTVADTVRISRASAGRCVKQVTKALRELSKDYIKFPNAAALPVIKEKFHEIAGEFEPQQSQGY